ncbi:DUF3006 family protein [Halalkalibacter kiskunsagensis]|uniref:DUF3006 family protein n=1 Tax=Halalkalibacter kiskunsagensis TaxID=1548599 RepID=A0ABV6KAC8_9BACI
MPIYTVDGVEDGIARLLLREDESIIKHVQSKQLPRVNEGDIIEAVISDEGEVARFTKLEEQTKNAKAQAKELLEKIRKKNK